MTPIKTRKTSFLFYVALPLLLAAGALFYTTRVRADGQQAAPEVRLTEQAVAETKAAGATAIKYATDFQWVASPGDELSSPGAKVVHLAKCPPGVFGNEKEYWVYISGSGRSEGVKVTGGSCQGDGQAGTLEFITTAAHPRGYTLSSASSGLQEASIGARWKNREAPSTVQGGKVVAPPGEFKIFAPLSFITSDQTIDFSGSMFECWVTNDACLKVGLPQNFNATKNVTLASPKGRATQLHGAFPMIEVNGQKTRILNLLTMRGVRLSQNDYGTFSTYVNVLGDQAFLLDGLDSVDGVAIECNETRCGTLLVAPGPFSHPDNAAVGWVKNAQISMQCHGNGIDWQSGNSLRVSDSVIQGFNQFGLRGGKARGGYGTIVMDNVYMEASRACKNPIGNVGAAGVLMQGSSIAYRGGEGPSGYYPEFAKTGPRQYDYYVVARHEKFGGSNPLYAGYAHTNGSGEITVTIPDIPGASSFDVLRVTPGEWPLAAPSGTGDFAVASNVARASACANGICTFRDGQAKLASYSVKAPSYFPKLIFWPGALVLGASGDSNSALTAATAVLEHLNGQATAQTNVLGMLAPAITSTTCLSASGSPLWMSCLTGGMPPATQYDQNALMLANKPNNDGGLRQNMKGRINLTTSGSGAGHLITLVDSNVQKTMATRNNRPENDAQDTFIGYDHATGNPATVGLSMGAPVSISSYVGNVGDDKSWKERLTDKQKTFAVPVVVESGSTLTVGGGSAISQMKMFTTAALTAANVPAQSCVDVKGSAKGLTAADQITGITPPKALGNLALNAYASAADTVILHFCNASPAGASVPAGPYKFLAVR